MPDVKKIPVVELFGPTLQGEGALAGQVSMFVRTGGCGFRCSWCDSLHAVLPEAIKQRATSMYQQEIFQKLNNLIGDRNPHGMWVTLTGGDPVMWDLYTLVTSLRVCGFKVAVETQGQLWKDWLSSCDLVTVSPKGPSSGMADKFDPIVLRQYRHDIRFRSQLILKFVIFNNEDLAWAEDIKNRMPGVRVFLSAGTSMDPNAPLDEAILNQYKWLAEEVLQRPEWQGATVLPQLHSLLWGRQLGR